MLILDQNRSRFEDDHDFKKDRNRNEGKMSYSGTQRQPSIARSDTVQPDQKNHKQGNNFLFCKAKSVHETPKISDVGSCNNDNNNLCGTQVR